MMRRQRGLAAAGRANECKSVNLIQIQIYILQNGLIAEGFAQIRRSKSHTEFVFRATESKV